jgi:hypothetical protein
MARFEDPPGAPGVGKNNARELDSNTPVRLFEPGRSRVVPDRLLSRPGFDRTWVHERWTFIEGSVNEWWYLWF